VFVCVSDPREVPPAPGTEPRTAGERERPYREDAGIYARSRADGVVPLTVGEIDARIMAAAFDLAGDGENPSRTPPFMEELVATFWHRLLGRPETRDLRLAGSSREQRVAAVDKAAATASRQRSERRVRELSSDRKRMARPFTGVFLTKPEALLLCVIPGFVIEAFGSAPSLDAAFDLGKLWSWVFACAISAILILAAEQLGNTLASAAGTNRRRARFVAGLLVVFAVAAGIWAVVRLADSRATNLAYSQASELPAASSGANGHFGAGAGSQATAPAEPEAAQAARPTSPDYGFFVPLSVLIMFTSMLFAFRIELAHDWNELERALGDAEGETEEAQDELIEANAAEARAGAPEDEATFAAAAAIEDELGLLNRWLYRFEAEYHRFCAARSMPPAHLERPAVPDAEEVLGRLARVPLRNPPSGGGGSGAGAAGNGAGGNGAGPTGGGSGPGSNEGDPSRNGGGWGEEPDPPRPEPSIDRRGPGRSGTDGSPKGFAFGG
jgi:hypothetical protein